MRVQIKPCEGLRNWVGDDGWYRGDDGETGAAVSQYNIIGKWVERYLYQLAETRAQRPHPDHDLHADEQTLVLFGRQSGGAWTKHQASSDTHRLTLHIDKDGIISGKLEAL